MEEIRTFLAVETGSGSGYGYGSGSDSGDGSGSGYGYGYGYGYGSGSGDGSGSGYGYGDGDGVSMIDGSNVYVIDGVQTIITQLRNNVAKGFILNDDLTKTPCYVVKHGNLFAHGETLHEAQKALQDKIFEDMDEDERIEAFCEEFNLSVKYPAAKFFDWHNKLTGSCEMGRKTFCKNHDIDVATAEFTVEEFIKLTENDFGGEIIKRLKECINS